MSKIIQPFGQIVKRIILECDERGAMKVVAVHVSPLGQETTMSPMEALFLFLKFSSDIVGLMMGNRQNAKLVVDNGGADGAKAD